MVKNLPANADLRDSGSVPGVGNGNPLQYSCLENSMDREAWWAIVHKVAESDMTLSSGLMNWLEQLTELMKSVTYIIRRYVTKVY